MREIKREALAQYDRKIEWAKKQDPKELKNQLYMLNSINEDWSGDFCSYCQTYAAKIYASCLYNNCPLLSKNASCCNGLWSEMNQQPTWGKWIKAAKKVRKYIKKHG